MVCEIERTAIFFNRPQSKMIDIDLVTIKLSQEEKNILESKQGGTLQKVLETVVLFGEALGAEMLVDIEGPGHFVIPWSSPGISPPIEMLEELVKAGLKTKCGFTLDPRPPLDFENLGLSPEEEQAIQKMYQNQARYDALMFQLGLRDKDAYTCNPYQLEVGNIPERGTILAWSESACAVFANSVLGARTNRNGAIMDLLTNIVGKTPLAGLLTDEGRRATWLIEVNTSKIPNPQLLGAAIGRKVQADVPYLVGLDKFLNPEIDPPTIDYLQDMGAMCATYGAVGLYHVENITPEAIDYGSDLLVPEYKTYQIDDQELEAMIDIYPKRWKEKESRPEKCFIGCPHVSLRQLNWWAEKLQNALEKHGKDQVAVETIICSAPQILDKLKADKTTFEQLKRAGVKFSASCCESIFETGLNAGYPIVTNSLKLRAYTTAHFIPDEALVDVLVRGQIGGKNRG